MSFTDFASGFFNSVSNTINTEVNKRNELDFLEKQERIREKVRQEAEDRRVAAKRMVLGGSSDQGPQQLMVEEYNPSGRVIGTRAASKGEEEEHVLGKQTRAANLAAATAEAEAKTREEDRKERKLESQLATDKARQAASYASAGYSRAAASNLASPRDVNRTGALDKFNKTVRIFAENEFLDPQDEALVQQALAKYDTEADADPAAAAFALERAREILEKKHGRKVQKSRASSGSPFDTVMTPAK